VSTVPVTPGVTINVLGVVVSTLIVLGHIVSKMDGWCRNVIEQTHNTINITLGTLIVTPGVTGTVLTYRLPTGRAPCLPSIYGQNDTLCKSEHFGGEL